MTNDHPSAADAAYTDWLAAVDRLLFARLGVQHDDLVDWTWADAHDDGLEPAEAVEVFLDETGEGCEPNAGVDGEF